MDKTNSQAMHVMTIANSIIGVSILAMPYCFKQCGIILSVIILILSNAISRLSCHLILKSAAMARRRTFEFLAFHAFGSLGKFMVEIGMIGFLLGTCIAYFVVMGDLGPAIIEKMTGTKPTDTLRTSILMALALFCVLPLGLLRNIDSLNSVSTATIGFYFCLVLKIIAEAIPHLFSGDWIDIVELWRPSGILQCLPIFSMALSCQTQIFEIYQAMPSASVEKMNNLIRTAVNICTSVYIFVGIFGYITFSTQSFTGNILMSFPTSLISNIMKIGFVLSLAFSFPLIIFPCRASLYSLLYRRTHTLHESIDKYIPESRFKGLTFVIVLVSLLIGVMIPNIELVLGLVGSTIGIMICVVFPATCFICISTKNTNERVLAQIMLFVGILVMVLGTYANLYVMEEISTSSVTEKVTVDIPDILKIVKEDPMLKIMDVPNIEIEKAEQRPELKETAVVKDVRHEPPQPEEPPDIPKVEINSADKIKTKEQDDEIIKKFSDRSKDLNKQTENKLIEQENKDNLSIKKTEQEQLPVDKPKLVENIKKSSIKLPLKNAMEVTTKKSDVNKEKNAIPQSKKVDEVDIEAIKKEDKELLEEEKEKLKREKENNMDLMKIMKKQNEDQQKIVEDQQKIVEDSKKLLEEIKQRQMLLEENKIVEQKKLKAVEEIQEIAKKAIEKLSGTDLDKSKLEDKPKENISEINKLNLDTVNKVNLPNNVIAKNDSKFVIIPMPLAVSNNYSNTLKKMVLPIVSKNSSFTSNEIITPKGEEKTTSINNKIIKDNKTNNSVPIDNRVEIVDIIKTKEKTATMEDNILHREIRSANIEESTILPLDEENVEKNCAKDDQNNKPSFSTEEPLKINSKLSLPELIDIHKLPSININNVNSILTPLKRDLKSYKYRKRK